MQHFRGMFAFVLFDEKRRRALVARDRMGKKPLYISLDDQRLVVSSEIKTFRAFSGAPLTIDGRGMQSYFALQFVPGPGTIYKEVQRLPGGSYLTVDLSTWQTTQKRYWQWQDYAVSGTSSIADIDAVDQALQESIRYRLIADVDVGILLSGGVDSTLIAYYAAQQAGRTVKAFTVAFSDDNLDESRYAADVARTLGLDLVTMSGSDISADLLTRVAYHAGSPWAIPRVYRPT
ncbi:MAG: 7-cyano-7-deazaguanine synthase [Ignavibacteriae bacterium]|nr:7-cyano-7-deazaguanine synthase [Ignavibacteriota bacterium]